MIKVGQHRLMHRIPGHCDEVVMVLGKQLRQLIADTIGCTRDQGCFLLISIGSVDD